VGLEEGLFPHIRSLGRDAEIEEERRLCYVGMTRARHELWLTRARTRRSFAAEYTEMTEPSRFLEEIPAEFIEVIGERTARKRVAFEGATYNSAEHITDFFRQRGIAIKPIAKLRGQRERLDRSEIALGSRVRHPTYGEGTVLELEGAGEQRKITVSFPRYGRKKLMEKYAGLVKVS
jgi:DNA helicase-2/ATP-dependent DNA helicase PcrA